MEDKIERLYEPDLQHGEDIDYAIRDTQIIHHDDLPNSEDNIDNLDHPWGFGNGTSLKVDNESVLSNYLISPSKRSSIGVASPMSPLSFSSIVTDSELVTKYQLECRNKYSESYCDDPYQYDDETAVSDIDSPNQSDQSKLSSNNESIDNIDSEYTNYPLISDNLHKTRFYTQPFIIKNSPDEPTTSQTSSIISKLFKISDKLCSQSSQISVLYDNPASEYHDQGNNNDKTLSYKDGHDSKKQIQVSIVV